MDGREEPSGRLAVKPTPPGCLGGVKGAIGGAQDFVEWWPSTIGDDHQADARRERDDVAVGHARALANGAAQPLAQLARSRLIEAGDGDQELLPTPACHRLGAHFGGELGRGVTQREVADVMAVTVVECLEVVEVEEEDRESFAPTCGRGEEVFEPGHSLAARTNAGERVGAELGVQHAFLVLELAVGRGEGTALLAERTIDDEQSALPQGEQNEDGGEQQGGASQPSRARALQGGIQFGE